MPNDSSRRSLIKPEVVAALRAIGVATIARCAENGVFAPLVGIIGTAQAAEALKLLMNIGESLQGRLLLLDALSMQWRTIKLARDPKCLVCA